MNVRGACRAAGVSYDAVRWHMLYRKGRKLPLQQAIARVKNKSIKVRIIGCRRSSDAGYVVSELNNATQGTQK